MIYIDDEQHLHLEGASSVLDGTRNVYIEPGSVILTGSEVEHLLYNIMPAYRDKQHECAAQMRATAAAIRSGSLVPKPPQPGYIDMTPTNASAFDHLALAFDLQVNDAQEWMAHLAGPVPDTDQ